MMPSGHVFPAPRVAPNPRHAFGGIFRLTLARFLTPGHWLILLGMLVLLALLAISSDIASRDPSRYFGWIAEFYLSFLVPVIAFINAGGAMRDDLKSTSVDYVLTRPVWRPAFVGFRYLSHLACAQVDFLFGLAVLCGLGAVQQLPGIASAIPSLLLAQVLLVAAFSAFGFLAGVLTSRYVIVGLAYGAVVELGVGQIPTQLGKLSMTAQVRSLLHELTGAPPTGLFEASATLLVFTAGMLALAALVFTLRELSGPTES
jgi:ABC-2 type transport system permease protein